MGDPLQHAAVTGEISTEALRKAEEFIDSSVFVLLLWIACRQ